MQFGVLAQVLGGVLFRVLFQARAHFCKIDGRMLRNAVWVLVQVLFFGMLFEVLVTVRAHFCKTLPERNAVLELVQGAGEGVGAFFARLTAGCHGACGCARAGV